MNRSQQMFVPKAYGIDLKVYRDTAADAAEIAAKTAKEIKNKREYT